MMRDNVRGLTAVLADGRVVRSVGRPRKDNAGYDLAGLLVGSEGTLGVITDVEVSLHPVPAASSVALLAVADLAGAVAAARAVQSSGASLLAAEVVDAAGLARAAGALGVADPLRAGRAGAWGLLIEVADGATGEGVAAVAGRAVAVATDAAGRARLWALRERQTELYAALGAAVVEKLDVGVRLDRLDEVVAAIRRAVAAADRRRTEGSAGPGAGPAWAGVFGHALDGNLHVQLVDAPPGTADDVLAAVCALGGSISAEHGIGRLKAAHLSLARSGDEIAWMRQVKSGVDPDGLLNPGVLLA
jgi:FAD/FMN-containing dehydrogenase